MSDIYLQAMSSIVSQMQEMEELIDYFKYSPEMSGQL